MARNRWWMTAMALLCAPLAWSQSLGQVVALGGHSSDVVLDEPRGVVYVANFTANRVDVVGAEAGDVQGSINVPSQPSSLAMSPDGRYLAIAHFGNFASPGTPRNALTVIDLNSRERQTYALANPPLGIAFGIDGHALVVTSTQFLRFDPLLGTTQVISTLQDVTANTLPQPPAKPPAEIVAASVQSSADGMTIYGLTDTIMFVYDVAARRVSYSYYVAEPPLGPRAISVAKDGAYYLAGWALFDREGMVAQFPNPKGDLGVGSHAIDSDRGIIYAQVPEQVVTTTTDNTQSGGTAPQPGANQGNTPNPDAQPPFLMVLDADNLTVRERYKLAENLSGKSILSRDGRMMYAISASGLTIIRVGELNRAPRVVSSAPDVVFRNGFCNRGVMTQEITISDPSGAATPFTLSTAQAGILISPTRGTTPATVRISIDPGALQNVRGTLQAEILLRSSTAVNYPKPIRVLANMQEPDQRGSFVNVPGKLVDLLADPQRNRFFILRQDTNEVLVFDGGNFQQVATLRTGNTPTSMAITHDRRYLLVGNDNSQQANVFDLETLMAQTPIRFPFGHYPRALAASGRAILAATRVAGPVHKIDAVDFFARKAYELPTLGVYENNININTAMVASTNGGSIMAAQANGNVLLYNANSDSFTISRKDFTALGGAYAASNYDQFIIGHTLFNASLVPVRTFDSTVGLSSGFAFVDQMGFRTGGEAQTAPGIIQRVDPATGQTSKTTRMVESPVLGTRDFAFTRTLAVLPDRSALINLTTSGFTVLPWTYDTGVAMPRINRVVNAADKTRGVAPGGLIVVEGSNLSPVNIATRERPLPTALGESCLTVNGLPIPMMMVSPSQINAQLPFQAEGNVTMTLHTPGGVSDNYNLTILPTAPSVFRANITDDYVAPTVMRVENEQVVTPANPIRSNDTLVIYLTGMGKTTPEIPAGVPAPADAPAVLTPPNVDIGGVPLAVESAGLAPGEIGVYQIRVYVPHVVPKGFDQPLRIQQGTYETTVSVRVID